MQLQKEKKHLQKTMQELELARKVELLSMLMLKGLPRIWAHLAVLNVSFSVLKILKLEVCKMENVMAFALGCVLGELKCTFGIGFGFIFCLFILGYVACHEWKQE